MERPYTFKTTKILAKLVNKPKEGEQPEYKTKKVLSYFQCDLNDISVVDKNVKSNGELYKTNCIITHKDKGDIVVNLPFEEVSKLVEGKIVIKGFYGK